MSAVAAVARVQELQALVDRARTQPAAAGGFSASLAAAQATTTTAPAAAAAAVPGTAAALPVSAAPSAAGSDSTYDALIQQSASAHGLDPALLKALISQESGFDPTAGSSAGARGLTQLMPGTAASLGVTDVTDPAQSIEGGAKYLAQQLKQFGSPELALAAYNAGPGAVERYKGVPPYAETQNYVRSVMAKAQGYAA